MKPDIREFFYNIDRPEYTETTLTQERKAAVVDCSHGRIGLRLEVGDWVPFVRFFYHPSVLFVSDDQLDEREQLEKYLKRFRKSRRPTNRIKQPKFNLPLQKSFSFFANDIEFNCFASEKSEVFVTVLSPKPATVKPLDEDISLKDAIKNRYAQVFNRE